MNVLCLISSFLIAFSAAQSTPKPFSRTDVLGLAAAGALPADITRLIEQLGISFPPTDEYIQMLRRASMESGFAVLERSLRIAKVAPPAEAPSLNEAALLPHLAQCGEANHAQNFPIAPDAERECRAALALAPQNPFVIMAVGRNLDQQGKRNEALAVYKRALAIDPSLAVGHIFLADALVGAQRRDEGLLEGIQALRLDPNNNEAIVFFGFLFGDSGVSDHDISTLRSEALRHPNDAVPHLALGMAYSAKPGEPNHFQQAITESREAVRLDPGNAWYHYFLGGMLSDSGDPKAALVELDRATKLDPDNDTFRLLYEYLAAKVKK